MLKKVLAAILLLGLVTAFAGAQEHGDDPAQEHPAEPHEEMDEHGDTSGNLSDYAADYTFTFKAELVDGKMVYTGVGGDIDGVQNPTLEVEQGAVVEVTLTNASVLEHDLIFSELGAHGEHILEGDTTVFAFEAGETGEYTYYCSVAGHKEAGMLGTLIISEAG